MSLRTALARLAPARQLSTSAARRSAIPGGSDAFADLARITATPEASSSSSSSSSAFVQPAAQAQSQAQRGFTPGALPPKVEPVLDLFTKLMMRDGKKASADRRAADILAKIQAASNQPPLPLLRRAIEMSAPSIRILHAKTTAVKTIQVPKALNERQRWHAGIKNLFRAAERGKRTGVRFNDRVAREVFAVLEGSSDVFKKVEEVHRQGMLGRSNLNWNATIRS
ncbi:hypothetical protein Q8F55_004387 [Vanrija albida]|uniref:Small ribosomal subunit protein uS7 domain-containing protein n=1 Tax=Vanrija albida TaxID=181172 RepID=A0ABR3Q6K8_9TREE